MSYVSTYRVVYCCIDFCFCSQVDVQQSEFESVPRPLGPFYRQVKVDAKHQIIYTFLLIANKLFRLKWKDDLTGLSSLLLYHYCVDRHYLVFDLIICSALPQTLQIEGNLNQLEV